MWIRDTLHFAEPFGINRSNLGMLPASVGGSSCWEATAQRGGLTKKLKVTLMGDSDAFGEHLKLPGVASVLLTQC